MNPKYRWWIISHWECN